MTKILLIFLSYIKSVDFQLDNTFRDEFVVFFYTFRDEFSLQRYTFYLIWANILQKKCNFPNTPYNEKLCEKCQKKRLFAEFCCIIKQKLDWKLAKKSGNLYCQNLVNCRHFAKTDAKVLLSEHICNRKSLKYVVKHIKDDSYIFLVFLFV